MSNTDKLIARLSEEAAPVTPWDPVRVIARWLIVAAGYLLLVTLALGIRPDIMMKLAQPLYSLELFLCSVVAATAGAAAAFLAIPHSNQERWIKWLPFFPMAVLGAVLIMEGGVDAGLLSASASTPQYSIVLEFLLLAVIPGIFLFAIIRSAATVKCCWAGSMAALAVGSLAYLVLRLVETGGNTADVMVWCYLPMLALTMTGMLLGKFLLRW